MTDADMKEKINASTRRSCLPGAREVHVRHCNEQVVLTADDASRGGICHLIHPDVTLVEFFAAEAA